MGDKQQAFLRIIGWSILYLVLLVVINAFLIGLLFLGAENHFGVSEDKDPTGLKSICFCSMILPMLPVINVLFLRIFVYPSYKKNVSPAIDILLAPVSERLKKTKHPKMMALLCWFVVGVVLNDIFFSALLYLFRRIECPPGSDADCGMAAGITLIVLGPTILTTFVMLNGILLLFAVHLIRKTTEKRNESSESSHLRPPES